MRAALAVVAGSGLDLSACLDRIDHEIPFHAWPGLVDSAVPGHASRFLVGRRRGHTLIVQCGRLHAYEGLPFEVLTRTVDALYDMGADRIIFTNAAGALRPGMQSGDLAAATAVWPWPFRHFALPDELNPDFLVRACDHAGPFVWMHGPGYETRAEIRALQSLGAISVGMSVAPELLRASQLGMRSAVVSCITNNCCAPAHLTHQHVLAASASASKRLIALLREFDA